MKSFIAIALFAIIAIASANNHADGGHSTIHRHQDTSGKYDFGYHINDPWGSANYREESGDGWGNVHGSYGLKLADGRQRTVNYVADKSGFRVKLDSNEPSVGSVDSADAIYNGADPHGHSHTHVPSGHKGGHHEGSWEGGYEHQSHVPHHEQGHDSWKQKDSWKPEAKHDGWVKH